MGTSQSSGGPPSGVPMVPPWVSDPAIIPTQGAGDAAPPDAAAPTAAPPQSHQLPPVPTVVPVAPQGRFRGARTSLGRFASSGSASDLRSGLGRYVKSGYGGSGTAARRLGGTAATAGALNVALSGLASGRPAQSGDALDPTLLKGKSAQDVMDAVVEAVRPIDGTQDAEASRAAIRDALSDLLTREPDADLANLTEDQRLFAIERYVAFDVYQRFALDLAKTIIEKAPTAASGLARLKQVKEYIRESVAAAFRKLRGAGQFATTTRVVAFVRNVLRETFEVFEGFAE